MLTLLYFGILGLAGSWLAGFFVYRLLRRISLWDQPNARSSHTVPTARGGGVGIVFVILVLGFVANQRGPLAGGVGGLYLVSLAVLAGISFWDDLGTLSWKVRFGAHAAVGAIFVLGVAVQGGLTPFTRPETVGMGFLATFFLVGYANAFNFMDGINGIAASQAVTTGVGTVAVSVAAGVSIGHPAVILAAIVAGAAMGFLPHNFPRAKMFMGDVGSVPLGFGLAALAVWIAAGRGWWLLVPLAGLHANFILDTSITLVRRVLSGKPFHQAHREHFYQKLSMAEWSHTRVTLSETALQTVAAVALTLAVAYEKPAVVLAAVVAVGAQWLCFFVFCEKKFRLNQFRLRH